MADPSADKPAPQTPRPTPPAGELPPSQQLFSEVRKRFEQLEVDLSQREQRLAQAERELRDGTVRLKAQRARFDQERVRLEQQFAGRLTESDKRLEQWAVVLREREEQVQAYARTEQELREQVESLTEERDEALAELAEARRELEEQRAGASGAVRGRAEAERPGGGSGEQGGGAGALAAGAGEAAGQTASPWAAGSEEHGTGRSSVLRRLIVVEALALTASAAAACGVYYWYGPAYQVTGLVTARSGDARTLAACAEQAVAHQVSVAKMDVAAGVLELVTETGDPAAGVARMDEAGQAILARFSAASKAGPTSQPASFADQQRLMRKLRALDDELAAPTGRPVDLTEDRGGTLLASWTAASSERDQIGAAMQALSTQPSKDWPMGTAVQVDPARLKTAEQADPKLQADVAAVRQREEELADALRGVLTRGQAHFETLAGAAAAGDALVAKALEGDQGPKVKEALGAIRESMTTWQEASAALAKVWRSQGEALNRSPSGGDPMGCQAELDRPARSFIDAAARSLIAFNKALESIAQDSEQPTKALVLRSSLTKDLQPLLDARLAVEAAARSVLLTDNLDLAAMVQRVSGLRRRIQERRPAIETSVRQQILADLRARHDQEIHAQRDRLSRRAAELDRAIAEYVSQARGMISRGSQERGWLTETNRREHERGQTLRSLVSMLEQRAAQRAAKGSLTEVRYVPARATLTESAERWLGRALFTGGGVLLGWLAIGLIAYAFRSGQRSRQAMDACARELQAASRRTGEGGS